VQYHITTPEQVTFRYEAAGLVTRAAAWVVDQLILLALRVGLLFAMSFLFLPQGLMLAAMLVSFFALDFGYFILAELTMNGRSPGKKAFALRVVPGDGTRLDGTAILVRNVLRPVDGFPLCMVLGGMVALIERYHRRLGDLAAGTLVIRETRAALPEALSEAQSRHNTFQADTAVRQRILNRVSRAERDLLYDLMLRRDSLAPAVREQLFTRAAAYCRQRFNLPSDIEHLTDEQTVLNVALVIHRSQRQMQRPASHGRG
jgi:uncharacterized RDD family membrane protein YckC